MAEFERLLDSRQVSLSYAYDILSQPPTPLDPPSDAAKKDSVARRIAIDRYFGDRLSLTLGPLVYSHSRSWRSGRHKYGRWEHVYDIRKSGSYSLEPGELLTVSTVEDVTLSSKYAAFVLPRLTLATAGLDVVTSYVDPDWTGILLLLVRNSSPLPQTVRFGEAIAVLRIYEVAPDGPPVGAQAFSKKSHHYGITWPRVLDGTKNPFVFRREMNSDKLFRRRLNRLSNSVRASTKYWLPTLSLGTLGFLVVWVVNLQQDISDALSAGDQVNQIDTQVAALQAASPVVYSSRVRIDKGEGEERISLPPSREFTSVILADNTRLEGVEVEIELTGSSGQQVVLLRAIGDPSSSPSIVTIDWIAL